MVRADYAEARYPDRRGEFTSPGRPSAALKPAADGVSPPESLPARRTGDWRDKPAARKRSQAGRSRHSGRDARGRFRATAPRLRPHPDSARRNSPYSAPLAVPPTLPRIVYRQLFLRR